MPGSLVEQLILFNERKDEKTMANITAKEVAEKIQSFFPDTDINLLATAIQSYKNIDAWKDNPILKEDLLTYTFFNLPYLPTLQAVSSIC